MYSTSPRNWPCVGTFMQLLVSTKFFTFPLFPLLPVQPGAVTAHPLIGLQVVGTIPDLTNLPPDLSHLSIQNTSDLTEKVRTLTSWHTILYKEPEDCALV